MSMFVSAWNDRTSRLGLCWKQVSILLYRRYQDPVSNFDPPMSWIPSQVPPLRGPKGILVFSLSPVIMSMHAGITDIHPVSFLLKHLQLVATRGLHSLKCIRGAPTSVLENASSLSPRSRHVIIHIAHCWETGSRDHHASSRHRSRAVGSLGPPRKRFPNRPLFMAPGNEFGVGVSY